jgi:terminal uridylyltransferase
MIDPTRVRTMVLFRAPFSLAKNTSSRPCSGWNNFSCATEARENALSLASRQLHVCGVLLLITNATFAFTVKVWSKRRKINSPYKGTLSSYGYVLLVIYFLVHVKNPPVLPNLQQMPPLRPITKEDTHLAGYNTWFFDDIELLRTRWHSENNESVAEL